jgi:hypothetical protein
MTNTIPPRYVTGGLTTFALHGDTRLITPAEAGGQSANPSFSLYMYTSELAILAGAYFYPTR